MTERTSKVISALCFPLAVMVIACYSISLGQTLRFGIYMQFFFFIASSATILGLKPLSASEFQRHSIGSDTKQAFSVSIGEVCPGKSPFAG